jgi:hypothetical protein
MERTAIEEKIHSMLEQIKVIPNNVRDEILGSLSKYTDDDLVDILEMLVTWDKELAAIYKTQTEQLSDVIKA